MLHIWSTSERQQPLTLGTNVKAKPHVLYHQHRMVYIQYIELTCYYCKYTFHSAYSDIKFLPKYFIFKNIDYVLDHIKTQKESGKEKRKELRCC